MEHGMDHGAVVFVLSTQSAQRLGHKLNFLELYLAMWLAAKAVVLVLGTAQPAVLVLVTVSSIVGCTRAITYIRVSWCTSLVATRWFAF